MKCLSAVSVDLENLITIKVNRIKLEAPRSL